MQKSVLSEPRMGVRIGGLDSPWILLARADMHEGSLGGSILSVRLDNWMTERKMGDRRGIYSLPSPLKCESW